MESAVSVPPSRPALVYLEVPQKASTIQGSWAVRGEGRVQALVLTKADADRFAAGRTRVSPVFASVYQEDGRFRATLTEAGSYALVFDNRLHRLKPVLVTFKYEVQPPSLVKPVVLSEDRRRVIVTLSLLFFGAVISLSALQFYRLS